MPRYAIVTVIEAQHPEEAWENIERQLLHNGVEDPVVYVGAPWLVPEGTRGKSAELETDGIQLRVNGKRVSLGPAD